MIAIGRSSLRRQLGALPLKATIGSLLAAGTGQLLLLGTGIGTARSLGTENRGYFALLTLLPAVLSTLCLLAVPTALTYYLSQTPEAVQSLFRKFIPIILAQCVMALVLHVVIARVMFSNAPRSIELLSYLYASCTALFIVQSYFLSALQGLQAFRAFNLLRNLQLALFLLFLPVASLLHIATLKAICLLWATSVLAVTLASGGIAMRTASTISSHNRQTTDVRSVDFVKFGAAGFLGYASPSQTFRIDQAAIGFWLPPSDLGLYVVASSITNLPGFISQSVGLIAYPSIAKSATPKSAFDQALRFTVASLILSSAAALTVFVLAPYIIPIFFGSDFAGAAPIARALAIAAMLLAAKRILIDCLRGLGRPGAGSIAELASWIVLPLGIAFAVSEDNLEMVGWALAASALAGVVICVYYAARYVSDQGPYFAES